MPELKTFGCDNCGSPITTAAPDDKHPILLVEKCPHGDSLERKIHCSVCSHDSIRYWDTIHAED